MKTKFIGALILLIISGCNSLDVDISKNKLIDTQWGLSITNDKNLFNEYPRPQMQREAWQNLCGFWDYAITETWDTFPTKFDGKILVPFAIESQLSGVEKTVDEKHYLWYRMKMAIPKDWNGQQIKLNFGAVDWHAKVYINKVLVGEHKGGFTPFNFDITEYLKKGKQEILVAVWDPTDKGKQPRGKQMLEPKEIFYTPVTGIWQPVWIEPVSKSHITKVVCVPDLDHKLFKLDVSCVNISNNLNLVVTVLKKGKQVLSVNTGINNQIELPIEKPEIWEPGNPNLYDIIIEIKNENETIDKVQTYSAMRKIAVGKDQNGMPQIMLNNKPIFQYGLLDQGWWPDGLLTPPSYDALRWDVDFTLKAGFNTIRKHDKTEPEVFYHYCDQKGVLVWQDMIHGDNYNYKNIQPEKDQEVAHEYEKELIEMIDFLRNYPCIIMWVPFNEGWGQYDTERVTQLVEDADTSRLIDSPSGWVDMGVGDVYDIHRYPGPGKIEDAGDRPFLIGEFGGLGCPIEGKLWNPEMQNWGYLTYTDKDEFKNEYAKLVTQLAFLKKQGLCGAIYTQTTDVEGEVNGLVTYDRELIKIPIEQLQAMHYNLLNNSPEYIEILADSEKKPQLWSYTMETPDSNWFLPEFNANSWKTGPGVFGYDNPKSQLGMSYARRNNPDTKCKTEWHTTDLWLRKEFKLDTIPDHPYLWVRYDDNAEIYINGKFIVRQGHRRVHYEHYALIQLTNEQKQAFVKGINTIAIHATNNLDQGILLNGANQSVDLGIFNREQ